MAFPRKLRGAPLATAMPLCSSSAPTEKTKSPSSPNGTESMQKAATMGHRVCALWRAIEREHRHWEHAALLHYLARYHLPMSSIGSSKREAPSTVLAMAAESCRVGIQIYQPLKPKCRWHSISLGASRYGKPIDPVAPPVPPCAPPPHFLNVPADGHHGPHLHPRPAGAPRAGAAARG